MRIRRPLAAAISAVLIASLGSEAPSSATAPATGEPVVTSTDAQRHTASRPPDGHDILPNGRHLPRKATLDQSKQKPAANDPHTVVVKLRSGVSTTDRNRLVAAVHGKLAGTVGSGYVKITTPGSAAAAITTLSKDPAVATVEFDRIRYLTATPNDPFYGSYQHYLSTIRMSSAWNLQKSATGVIVAVVDTGVDTGHPDLVGRTVAGYNAVSPGSSTTDSIGHGTFVSGIIAANTNNGVGMASVTWNGRVMPIKVFSGQTANDSDIVEGITWAVGHGAKVINLSLGGPGDSNVLHDAIKNAVSKGVVVVAAAGNTGDNVPQYPAAFPEVISVGATDDNANLTDFSSWGEHVDIAAPGFDVFSTFPRNSQCNPYCYGWWSGTSFSAPQVAGVAALVKAKNPSWSPAQVINRLKSTARDAGPRGIDPYYGWGVLDAYAALGGPPAAAFPQRADGTAEPNDVPARAAALPVGSEISAAIAMEGDVDWYKVELAQDGTLTTYAAPPAFSEDRPQNLDIVLALYDSKLHLIDSMDSVDPAATEQISMLMPVGTYYVKVTNYNGAADTRNYRLGTHFSAQPPVVVPPFVNPTNHSAGGSFTEAVAIGDVTNDGKPDVLAITSFYFSPPSDYKLLVSTQKPDGTFGDIVIYPTINDAAPTGLAVLDATGDGKVDAVVGTANGVEVHAQNAAGTLDAGVSIATLPGIVDLTAADIDGDGDQDIIASGAGIYVLTQGPAGVFSSAQIAASDQGMGETEVGDLNSDGRLDVASFGPGADVAVHLNTPDGWTHTTYPVSNTTRPYGIEVADVTGDGKADLVSVSPFTYPQALDVFKQQANGTLAKSQTIDVSGGPTGVEAADWDLDGRMDLVVAVDGGPTRFFRQQADGTLGAGVNTAPQAAQWPDADCIALADLNGDNYPDAVSALDFGAGFVTGYNSHGVPPEPGITLPLGPQDWVWTTNIPDFSVRTHPVTKVTITMQVALDPATVNGQSVKLVNGKTGAVVPMTVSYNAGTRTISLYHTITTSNGSLKYLPPTTSGTAYRLVIGAVRGTDGSTNPGYSLSFVG
jgi:type VII secretion-associated serine protease mycosin